VTDVLYKTDRTEKEDEDLPDLNPDSEGDTGANETDPEGGESFVLEENVIDAILPDMSDDQQYAQEGSRGGQIFQE
jgi:hypothetical protein